MSNFDVSNVRKNLSIIRKSWVSHSKVIPFYICNELAGDNMSISEFSFRFVIGHHARRHQKTFNMKCSDDAVESK